MSGGYRPEDPERALAIVHAPVLARVALGTLWELDERLGQLTSRASEPMIALLKLTWWRDALTALGSGKAPAEPLLEALSTDVIRRGIEGAALAGIAEGWQALLQPPLDNAALVEHALLRGEALWRVSALLLGREATAEQARAGGGWALVDLVRQGHIEPEPALELARARFGGAGRWPRELRPIGMLAIIARSDASLGEPLPRPGSPRRIARMLWHRFSGL